LGGDVLFRVRTPLTDGAAASPNHFGEIVTTLMQDVRYALRQLRKTPGFTITVMLTLALGIGANAAIFTLVNSVLLQNLPVADPKMLVRLGNENDCCVNSGTSDNGNYSLFATDTYELLKKNVPEFEELAAMESGFPYRPVTMRRDGTQGEARSVMGEFVSGNYFRTFGLQPRAGRLFMDADDVKGAPATAVMSYQTWQSNYAGDASVIGSTFFVNTKPVTVVGVAPQGFFGDRMSSTPPDFYLPLESMASIANAPFVHDPRVNWLYMVGRVKPGVALIPLQQKVSELVRESLANIKDYTSAEGKVLLPKVHVVLAPGGAGITQMQEQYGSHLHLLMWVAGLVLLIACANIANLLLVRGMARKTELSVRNALGAGRARIIRQLLTESVVLALLGGLAGLFVAYVGAEMLLHLAFPAAQGLPIHAAPSLPVIGFACGLSLLTGILFGVAPAWIAAQAQPADALRSGSRSTATGSSRLQRSLVVLQAAVSLVLLIGAGLFSQSLNKLQHSDLKLDSRNRYIVHINPQAAGYSQTQLEALYRTMEQQFHALPGVVNVGVSTYTPMEDNNWGDGIQIQGQPTTDKGASWVRGNGEYFDSVGTHVLMGRGIRPQDTSASPVVAVVNQAFVKTFFKDGSNPIGQHFGAPGPKSSGDFEIVGVVEDTTYTTVYWKNHSMYFVPMMQRPASSTETIDTDMSLYAGAIVVQTERPMNDMEKLARTTLSAINPNLTVVKFQTFDEQIADRFGDERLIARLTTLFGGLALLLAAIGLYGVTAYNVVRRTPEIGIRMAVGAARGSVIAMVMRGAIIQIAIGLAIGIPVALLCVRFVKAQLYEITSASPSIVLFAIVTLSVAACVAGIIPARRAASIDPVKALRSE
jgi:macrolide transport system ATP-binding/permease protein